MMTVLVDDVAAACADSLLLPVKISCVLMKLFTIYRLRFMNLEVFKARWLRWTLSSPC